MEKSDFFQQLFEKAPIGLNLCRMDGLWLESNPAFLRIIGYTAEEANGGLTYWQLTPEEYREQEAEQLASLQKNKRYGPYEKEFIRKDGSRVPVLLHGFVTERDGESYIWSFIEDLSDKRKAQTEKEEALTQLIVNSRMASLGTMAAGIAHEINNPLAVIYVHLERLLGQKDKLSADVAESLEKMSLSAERIKKIVSEMGIYVRPRGGESASSVTFSVHDCLKQIIGLMEEVMHQDGVHIHTSFRAVVDGVRGEPSRFQQVLVNLITNARDAMAQSPTKDILIETDSSEERLRVYVRDTGQGMEPAVLARIFDSFFTTKEIGKGTGLGLSISNQIIRSMGGTIRVESTKGRGTVFILDLPLSVWDAPTPATPRSVDASSLGPRKVLLVEDNEELRNIVCEYLKDRGCQVTTAADGRDGLEKLRSSDFDLVITDEKMPRMGGIEMLRTYQRENSAGGPRAAIMTGDLNLQDSEPLRALGPFIAGLIQKPDVLGGLSELWFKLDAQANAFTSKGQKKRE